MTVPAHEQAAPPGEHAEREDDPWAVAIPDHPARTESEGFRRSKQAAHEILAAVREQAPDGMLAFLAGPSSGRPQAHHAGSLWVFDSGGWFLLLNTCGVEWSAQWSADPARVEELRQAAARLYARFPETLDELDRLGYPEGRQIISNPVTDMQGVARWTDSLFNACVMLSAPLHTGVVHGTQAGGFHHYPKSVWDQQATKLGSFRLWVTAGDGTEAAVAPAGPGGGRVEVIYARPGTDLHREQQAAHAAGERHILGADHPLAVQAFAGQQEAP